MPFWGDKNQQQEVLPKSNVASFSSPCFQILLMKPDKACRFGSMVVHKWKRPALQSLNAKDTFSFFQYRNLISLLNTVLWYLLIYIWCICINHVGEKFTQVSNPFKELSRHRNTINSLILDLSPRLCMPFASPKRTENIGWPGF